MDQQVLTEKPTTTFLQSFWMSFIDACLVLECQVVWKRCFFWSVPISYDLIGGNDLEHNEHNVINNQPPGKIFHVLICAISEGRADRAEQITGMKLVSLILIQKHPSGQKQRHTKKPAEEVMHLCDEGHKLHMLSSATFSVATKS